MYVATAIRGFYGINKVGTWTQSNNYTAREEQHGLGDPKITFTKPYCCWLSQAKCNDNTVTVLVTVNSMLTG